MNIDKQATSIIRHFSPAWFAASMGTGGLANALFQLGSDSPFLQSAGKTLFIVNIVVFIGLLVPWVLRWFYHYDQLIKDLEHAVLSNFFVTMPVSAVVLGTNVLLMGGQYISSGFALSLSLGLWIFGSLLIFIFGVYVTFNMMTSNNISPQATNFSWFITPVASIVVPLLGNGLVARYSASNMDLAQFINVMDLSFFGIGFILFIILSGIVINRFIYHQMPGAAMVPTFWILLGPIGISVVALMGLADVNMMIGYLDSVQTVKLLALIIWGFGFWAVGLNIMITLMYIKEGTIPFTISWWAFIFPIAAYSLGSLSAYKYTNIEFIKIYSIILITGLFLIWLVTFVRSIIGMINKTLLLPQTK